MSSPFLGQVMQFGGNFAIRGWAFCDGQLLPISQYSALFSILGTTYGGDGRTTFALPDLRGRVAVHEGNGPGLSPYSLGQKSGRETAVVPVPAHTHLLKGAGAQVKVACNEGAAGETEPQGKFPAATSENAYASTADAVMGASTDISGSTASTGTASPTIDVRQPYLALNWEIALQGIFPSRN